MECWRVGGRESGRVGGRRSGALFVSMGTYRVAIARRLRALSPKKKLIFAVLTAEHLMPGYVHFVQIHQWGAVSILENALIFLRACIFTQEAPDELKRSEFIAQIETVTPDTEDFDNVHVSFALDACVALTSALRYLKSYETDDIVDVAICARDTVDMYVHNKITQNLDRKQIEILIESDPLVQREKRRQSSLIAALKVAKITVPEDLAYLRGLSPWPVIE